MEMMQTKLAERRADPSSDGRHLNKVALRALKEEEGRLQDRRKAELATFRVGQGVWGDG